MNSEVRTGPVSSEAASKIVARLFDAPTILSEPQPVSEEAEMRRLAVESMYAYSAAAAAEVEYETIDFPGVVSAEQAFRLSRRHLNLSLRTQGYSLDRLPPWWAHVAEKNRPEGYVLIGMSEQAFPTPYRVSYATPVGKWLLDRAASARKEAWILYKDHPWLAAIRRNDAMTLQAWADRLTINKDC